MKKVLIVSYYFHPCNITASQRALSWARYLNKYGYKPIVLTRRWDHKINSPIDVSRDTPNQIVFESHNEFDVYYLPYISNFRDKILVRYGLKNFYLLRRLLSLFELLFQNIFSSLIPYYNLFSYAEKIVASDRSIDKVVITGNPFNLFKIGYTLKKKFGTSWIADYRDAWTTSEIYFQSNKSFAFRIVRYVDRFFEKKWVSTATAITASSLPIANDLTKLTGTQGHALYNGFVTQDFEGINPPKFSDFTITYVGTLYNGQKVEILCAAVKKLINTLKNVQIKLLFPGLAYDSIQSKRVADIMIGYEKYFEITQRMERKDVLKMERQSHLLLHVAWDEQKGIIASKIYEYLASGTYILVVPSDNGSIQEIIEKSNCGICINTADDAFDFLKKEYERFIKGDYRRNDTNKPNVLYYSRENQTKILADLLNTI